MTPKQKLHLKQFSPLGMLLAVILFVLSVGLACNTPVTQNQNQTKIAINVQATKLSQGHTQTAQAKEEPSQSEQQPSPEVGATEPAQAATQTDSAEESQEDESPTETPQPTETQPEPTQTDAISQDFETWLRTADILLYEDMTADYSIYRYIKPALEAMSLDYVDVKDALGEYKNQLLSGGPDGEGWDLIISGKELRQSVQGEFYVYLNDALNMGSAVIIEEWDIDGIAAGKISTILSRCGVELFRDWIEPNIDRHLLYPVDGSHPIHHEPNQAISLTNPSGYWINTDLGDLLELRPGSDAVPLWSARVNIKDSYLTAVACFDNRLIIQTYSSHSYGQDRIELMWQNYIYNALKARYDYLQSQ